MSPSLLNSLDHNQIVSQAQAAYQELKYVPLMRALMINAGIGQGIHIEEWVVFKKPASRGY